ncbi:MAG: DMT family transporter [Acidimicrobiales bacterium]
MAIVFGLAVALAYGVADFLGGRTSRGDHPAVVVAMSQVASVVPLALLLAVDASPVAEARSLAFGAGSGVAGLLGVLLLYRGLSLGAMGVIAPITAVGAAVVPVTYGLATGERPSGPALVGIVLALLSVALIASVVPHEGSQAGRVDRREVALAAAAGASFGFGFIFLAEAGEGSGFWPVAAARGVSLPLVLAGCLIAGRRLSITPGSRVAVSTAGFLDVLAIGLYLLASRRGLISLVAVLGSLYPATTVLLARIVLGERLVRLQVIGLVLALAGVVLIAA